MSQSKNIELARRRFIERAGVMIAGFSALNLGAFTLAACREKSDSSLASSSPHSSGPEEPSNLSWRTVITSNEEPGRPLIVSGRIFGPDGKTPLEGITIHVYHTDNRGLYTDDRGNGVNPPARLRGWMKTDRDGRYEFRTIKPASYPNTDNPEHIHSKVFGPGFAERWIDNFNFDDDPLITREMRSRVADRGNFSPVMAVTRGSDGILQCVRDIRLERTLTAREYFRRYAHDLRNA
jgi:protocatechuate 3,4-dioxygenase beta subunit